MKLLKSSSKLSFDSMRPRSRRTTSTGRCRPPCAAARPHAGGARDGGVAMEDEEPVDSPTAAIVDRALPHPATPCVPPVACPASLLWICIGGGVAVPVPPRCIGLDARVSAAAAASACGRPRGVPSPGDTVAKGAGAAMASTCDGRWLAPSLPGVRDLERPTLIQQLRLSTLGCVVAVLRRRRLEMATTVIGMAKKRTRAFSAGQERHVQEVKHCMVWDPNWE